MKKSAEQGADYADTDYAASKEKKTSMEWSFDYNGLFEDSTAKKGKPSKKSKSPQKGVVTRSDSRRVVAKNDN